MVKAEAIHNIQVWLRQEKKSVGWLADETKKHDPEGKGVSRVYLHHIFSGRRQPNDDHVRMIAKAIKMPRSFVRGEGAPYRLAIVQEQEKE